MHAHVGEVVPEPRLHEGARCSIEWFAGRGHQVATRRRVEPLRPTRRITVLGRRTHVQDVLRRALGCLLVRLVRVDRLLISRGTPSRPRSLVSKKSQRRPISNPALKSKRRLNWIVAESMAAKRRALTG